jgi:DNA-binding transcriptional MerR regulator
LSWDAPFLDFASVPARRGVYTAERASQLSGVPRTTVYYWARTSRLVVPSISSDRIKLWSYRDLVLLRFVAWLRKHGVGVSDVLRVLDQIHDEPLTLTVRTGERRVFLPTDDPRSIVDILSSQTALAGELAGMLPEFELQASEVGELGRKRLWGPNLISPSAHTRIHPDVLVGEPFVERTRIPTASLFALVERSLPDHRVAELYDLELTLVREALWLESSMRAGRRLPAAA